MGLGNCRGVRSGSRVGSEPAGRGGAPIKYMDHRDTVPFLDGVGILGRSMRYLLSLTSLVRLSFLMVGCATVSISRDSSPELYPYARSVGILWIGSDVYCSGVLVAPDKVLTAGHCVGFTTGYSQKTPVTFRLGKYRVDAKKWYSLADQAPGENDLAIVVLKDKLPGTPADVGGRTPEPDDLLLWVGYGCEPPRTTEECIRDPRERRVLSSALYFRYNQWASRTLRIYHGDSGGALFDLRTGRVIAIGSATNPDTGVMWFGDPTEFSGIL